MVRRHPSSPLERERERERENVLTAATTCSDAGLVSIWIGAIPGRSPSRGRRRRRRASLLGLIHDHHHSKVLLRDRAEKAKKDAIRSAAAVSDLLVQTVNGGVQEAFLNQKRIELEIRALTATVSRFTKQTDHWLASTHALNSAVKEIGDFENWSKIMDYDCKSINAAIRNIHQA